MSWDDQRKWEIEQEQEAEKVALADEADALKTALEQIIKQCGMHKMGLRQYECVNQWCKIARKALAE